MNHFFDIGSNRGNTFDWYLLKTDEYDGWHIWCFEPSMQNMRALRDRCLQIMEDNTHNFRITLCAFGLSDDNRPARIFETIDSLGDSIYEYTTVGTIDVEKVDSPLQFRCGLFDAASFIKRNTQLDDTVVLKIDTEGSELEILESILRAKNLLPRIRKMLIEFHGRNDDVRQGLILEQLQETGIEVEPWTL